MSITKTILVSTLAAAGVAIGASTLGAPVATAGVDPCRDAVSTSRCLGPAGVQGFNPNSSTGSSAAGGNVQNGPYGAWGNVPPLGR